MKMEKHWKRFFTLDRHHAEGFTLVELIVVIAILAILAGVAVPAYSGYIEKANEAADLQLLGAVNNAFAVACIENNLDIEDMEGATILIDKQTGLISGMSLPISTLSATPTVDPITTAVYASFEKYYGDNMNTPFKVYTELHFVDGGFVDISNVETLNLNYGGITITVPVTAVNALKNSTYGTVIGAEELLTEVAALTKWADADGNAIVDRMGDDYALAMARYLGFADDPSKLDAYFAQLEADGKGAQINTMTTNGLVLYAAENFATMDDKAITDLLNSDNIYSNLSDDPAEQLAQASMVYGLYTGYVNSEYYNAEDAKTSDPVGAVKAVSSSEHFKEYVNSAQGQADLAAYKEAMGVINDASANPDAMEDVLANGYDNAELIGLLQQVMGK